MSTTATDPETIVSFEDLDFVPFTLPGVFFARVDWFKLLQAKVFRYPKGHEIGLHYLSGEVLLFVLKGRVGFREQGGREEIAGTGMFRRCGKTPWTTHIHEDSYILIIEKEDTQMVMV